VRTAVGFFRDQHFFQTLSNADEVLKVGISQILPMEKINEQWLPLMPVPADLVLTGEDEKNRTVNPLTFEKIEDGSGTDIDNREWLIPTVNLRNKPAKENPFFFHWSFYEHYLKGELKGEELHSINDIGISQPISDIKIHNAINPNTFIAEEGKLFSNKGFYLKSKNDDQIIDLAICFQVKNADSSDIAGDAYLGGERKRIFLAETDSYFPKCPDYFKDRSFLKLILTTHGDFGDWCPQWLQPDLEASEIDWVKIPGTDFEIRLRSACVSGWNGVSGWDYKTKKPKAMKKLVLPGSVFVIEIKDKNKSVEIAEFMWGNSLCLDHIASINNGYGQCIVGNAIVNEIN